MLLLPKRKKKVKMSSVVLKISLITLMNTFQLIAKRRMISYSQNIKQTKLFKNQLNHNGRISTLQARNILLVTPSMILHISIHVLVINSVHAANVIVNVKKVMKNHLILMIMFHKKV